MAGPIRPCATPGRSRDVPRRSVNVCVIARPGRARRSTARHGIAREREREEERDRERERETARETESPM